MMKKIDPELLESWRRHPVTAEIMAAFSEESVTNRYRGAVDQLTLGQAQGWDHAAMTIRRMVTGSA